MDLMQEQLRLENLMCASGANKFDEMCARAAREGDQGSLGAQRRIMATLVEPIEDALTWAEEEAYKPGAGGNKKAAGVRLLKFYSGSYKLVAFLTLRHLMSMTSPFVVVAAQTIGRALEDQLRFAQNIDNSPKYMAKVMDNINKQRYMRDQRKRAILAAADRKLNEGNEWIDWTITEQEAVGLHCIHATVVSTGAFRIERGVIQLTTEMADWITEDTDMLRELSCALGPCVIPPRPWVSPSDGGYHSQKLSRLAPLVRAAKAEYVKELHKPYTIRQMQPFYKAINIVQNTGWHINSTILDLLWSLRKSNSSAFGLPTMPPDGFKFPEFNAEKKHVKLMVNEDNGVRLVYPGDPDYERKGLKFLDAQVQADFIKWKYEKSKYMQKRAVEDGAIHKMLLTLAVADTYRDFESIYFVHHADTRGRIYPYSALLSPQGCDMSKAMLEFDKDFPLDIRFLKLQITGLHGFDKVAYKERIQWCDDHHEELMSVGMDPLSERSKAFVKADESPFQFIAACRDYYLHFAEGKQTTRLWWAQDGACNGLQHFSMMLRDEVGGALVNLVPSATPSDIYQHVAEQTLISIDNDKVNTEQFPNNLLFNTVAHEVGVTRKTTKRSTMIKPYSGTVMGSLDYVKEFYEEWDAKHEEELSKRKLGKHFRGFCGYMNTHIWKSVEGAVPKATEGMGWLKRVGHRIGSKGKAIMWTVPGTGFLAFQKKMDLSRVLVRSVMYGNLLTHSTRETAAMSKSGMGNSMAPNFVHSLDSAHMLTTVLSAAEQGITHFALVHDSYGVPTHQSNDMAYLIRDAFYHLYTDQDVLDDFRVQQQNAHPEVEYPELPSKGTLNATEVYRAGYLFS